MRGGGRKFNQSLLMVLVLEGEQLCSQNLLFNLGVFRQQEVRPLHCLLCCDQVEGEHQPQLN